MIAKLLKSKLDLALWIAVALLVAGAVALVNHWRLDSNRLKVAKAERKVEQQQHADQVAGLNSIIEGLKADAQLNRETTIELAKRLKAADDERRNHPLRLRCYVPPAATAPAESGAAGGTDDSAARRVDGGADLPTFDAAPGLSEFQRRCAVNAATLATLQEWEANRTH